MLDFAIAFFTAALSATGVGGGGLLILYLRLVKNIPQVTSQGINLVFFVISSVCAAIVHLFKRRLCLSTVLICGIFGFFGAFLGFAIVKSVDVSLLEKAFGALIAACGIKTFFSAKKQ